MLRQDCWLLVINLRILSALCRGVTPRRRTRGSYGLSLLLPSCSFSHRRHLQSITVLVHDVSRRVWGLRLPWTDQEVTLDLQSLSPSGNADDRRLGKHLP